MELKTKQNIKDLWEGYKQGVLSMLSFLILIGAGYNIIGFIKFLF